ncbi:MAG: DUF262 domain-containing HNH endonuclease family protein [Pseudomonadota bacterium]
MAQQQHMVSVTRGIGQLISERRYFSVPQHQRDYAWPIGSVEQYVEDVVGALDRDDADYFLGLLVLVADDTSGTKRFEILDGQQRLATTTMIYAAIRQWLVENGFESEATKIQNEFIGISEIGVEEDEPRIVMNLNNQQIFQEIVVSTCSLHELEAKTATAGRYTSTRKLCDAALRCRQLVASLAEAQGTDKKARAGKLFDLAKYLRDNVQVNCLDVTAPENAYMIFESLNDRGIDLSVLDLLKNHLFRVAKGPGEQQIQTNWALMMARLGDRRADDFLKAFWTSRYGRIQRGRLFHELKRRYDSRAKVIQLSKELARVAEQYAGLEVADSELWKSHGAATQDTVRALDLLGGKQTHPIVLAALDRFDANELGKLLRSLVTLILRYQLIGRGRTGRLEIRAAAVAEGIYTKKHKHAKSAWDNLKAIIPPDDEFAQDFAKYENVKPAVARWLFRALELKYWVQKNPGKAPELAPIHDPELVNLEHVLPRKPGAGWAVAIKVDPKLVDDCASRFGNLCLLYKTGNKKVSSKAFAEKKPVLAASNILLTRQIATYPDWDRTSIDARQVELSKIAIAAWPV